MTLPGAPDWGRNVYASTVPLAAIATTGGTVTVNVPVQSTYRTLTLICSTSVSSSAVATLTGNVTGWSATVALTGAQAFIVGIPSAAYDTSFSVSIVGGGAGNMVYVVADQDVIQTSIAGPGAAVAVSQYQVSAFNNQTWTSTPVTWEVLPLAPISTVLIVAPTSLQFAVAVEPPDVFGAVYQTVQCSFGDNNVPTAIFPGAWPAGAVIVAKAYLPGGGPATFAAEMIATGAAIPVQLRADGRRYPIGLHAAAASSSSSASVNVIAAPGAGLRVLLKSLQITPGQVAATSQLPSVTAHIGGSLITLAAVQAGTVAGTSLFMSWPDGLLLDANTALVFSAGGTLTFSAQCEAVYDIVV